MVKVLNGRNRPEHSPQWLASDQPRHWNYWRREAAVYVSEFAQIIAPAKVRLPRVLGIDEREEQVVLTLEDVQGRSGAALKPADYPHVCHAWGHAQALLSAADFDAPWLSQRFVRTYTDSKGVRYDLLDDEAAWSQALIRENWPVQLREGLSFLHARREELLAWLEAQASAVAHLDFWPNNVFIDNEGWLVLIDLGFVGRGAWAEDVGNFVPDAVFDGFRAADELPKMTQACLAAYSDGLRSGGAMVDDRLLTKNLYASAVKYDWLGPLLLARAGSSTQSLYGGAVLDDASYQYAQRGATLQFLCDWARRF